MYKCEKILKYLLDEISFYYTIIIYKGEYHEEYILHLLRPLLLGPNSTFNCFIQRTKYEWYTGIDISLGELIGNFIYK